MAIDWIDNTDSAMRFPKALTQFEPHEQPELKSAVIGAQPATTPDFHFGQQPEGLKDVDAGDADHPRRKIGIVGAGDVYSKFVRWALDQRGAERYIVDTRPELPFALNPLEHRVNSLEHMPKDIDYIMVLTPPNHHGTCIREAQNLGFPSMVEKPLLPTAHYMTDPGGLNDKLEHHGSQPIYAMDWEVALATPLMAALNLNTPFKDIVEYTNKDKFAEFDMKHITAIEATFLEGGDNPLGDVEKAKKDRPWAFDIKRGGGALYDMGVHPLNTLAAMGFTPGKVLEAEFGEPMPDLPKGTYRRIGNNEETAEFYARGMVQMHLGDQTIPTLIEAGKGGLQNDMRTVLKDDKGHTITWEYGPDKSVVTMTDKDGAVVATAASHVDPYALMIEEATRFFDKEKAARAAEPDSYKPSARYYKEHEQMLELVERMHEVGRVHTIAPGSVIHQLAADEPKVNGVDLGGANVQAPAVKDLKLTT